MHNLIITTVQTNLHWEDKNANLQMLEEKIGHLNGGQVVVLPEMFSTGFSMQPEKMAETMDGPTVNWMRSIASNKNIVLTGSLIIQENDKYFNRLIWMLPNGQCGHYDKRHLFAFAGEDKHYSPGNKRLIVSIGGWRILMLTCYDLRFPVWSRQQIKGGEPEYDAIIYVANWPERRSHAWKSLLVARAIENQCFIVGVNRDISTHILEGALLENIRQKLPFLADADRFSII
ncbi:MAG: nitrilase family protein [Chitinophagaceae bacterium]|nr:nitrilase family protein [Chitinophagaceae bacterium]